MTTLPEDVEADLRQRIFKLERRLDSTLAQRDEAIERQTATALVNFRLQNELRASLERQNASAAILRTIASTFGDAERALQQIAETTARLFNASSVTIRLADGDEWGKTIRIGASAKRIGTEVAPAKLRIEACNLPGAVFRENRQIHIPDLSNVEPAIAGWPGIDLALSEGTRSMAGTPLRREGKPIGVLIVYCDRPAPFTAEELALQQSFAEKAVIAIENARLFNETREALQRQAATASILSVINRAGGNLAPVFDSILEHAHRLCGAPCGSLQLYENDRVVVVAIRGMTPQFGEFLRHGYAITEGMRDDLLADHPLQIVDVAEEVQKRSDAAPLRAAFELGGIGTMTTVPLLKNGVTFGRIVAARQEVRLFEDKQIALLEGFAAQAVIAIENVRLLNETKEALERQTATADVLRVIASSPSDVQPVFEAIATRAKSLVGAFSSTVFRFIGGMAHLEAFTPTTREADEFLRSTFPRPVTEFTPFRLTQAGEVMQIPDTEALTDDIKDIARARGFRSMVFAPLMSKGVSIGFIAVTRVQTGAFANHYVELLKTFADQAVIAIENTRLFEDVQAKTRDLEESLQQQTATADVLKVIGRSAFDLNQVFETVVESSVRLCAADRAIIFRFDGEVLRVVAMFNAPQVLKDWLEQNPIRPGRHSVAARAALERRTFQVEDVRTDPEHSYGAKEIEPFRTVLGVPMLKGDDLLGVILVYHNVVKPFTDKQILLVSTFAEQAAIAIENVRLFEEVEAKTRDLEESLQVQTASSEVLRVISSSPDALQPVLDVIVETSRNLCGSDASTIFLLREDGFHPVAVSGTLPAHLNQLKASPQSLGQSGSILARLAREGRTLHFANVLDDPDLRQGLTGLGGARALLSAPLLRDGRVIGAIILRQSHLKPFTPRQIEAIEVFADQAVIAISNVGLFGEVQAKTRDLEESLQQQTATADVLKVISRSAFDLQTVLNTLVSSAARLCDADMAFIMRREDDVYRAGAAVGFSEEYVDFLETHPIAPDRGTITGRAVIERRTVQIADVAADPEYTLRESTSLASQRTALGVPLLRENEPIGVIVIARKRVEEFSEKQIELVSTFADQAVIAIENVRLFDELRRRTNDLAASLDDLRAAQDRLIQTEKLASLGQLTAGIAHEIKNPLNFVNNFAALSAELTDELNDHLKSTMLADSTRREVEELTGLLKDNLQKVVQHGKRADSIVKNMLLHSREGSGEHRPVDVNALVDESLNLAYHGARAEKPQFNVTLMRNFDPDAGTIEVFPQEITRVLLNLISNGFYAVTKRKADNAPDFEPLVTATTKGGADRVEIRIRDNGTGIAPDVKQKMFNPFFTTKPAGEGTGLGLSMSHDIIVKQHGGTIEVDTLPDEFTEFTIVLPRKRQSFK